MLANLGHYLLLAALFFSLSQVIAAIIGQQKNNQALHLLSKQMSAFACASITTAFAVLIYAYVTSDFSVANVALNSHTLKPLLYKISGPWSNHEGSMMLWCFLLSVFATTMTWRWGYPTSTLYGSLVFLFSAFVFFTSSPFVELIPTPKEGLGLNPILQNPSLAFHPPFLYMGYLCFSVPFILSLAKLINPKLTVNHDIRRFSLLAWSLLTIGIMLGSLWAYEELGWGGWWFWDPVENASLMPWLAGTMLIHSLIANQKTNHLSRWSNFLAIITFSLCLLGLFLVRSGVLTSVHSFANDPRRGFFILSILGITTGFGLWMFAKNYYAAQKSSISPITREGFILLNNLFLCVILASVISGTLFPLISESALGQPVAIGPGFFTGTITPIMIPMLVLMIIVPQLIWKNQKALSGIKLSLIMTGALILVGLISSVQKISFITVIGFTLAIGVICASLWRIKKIGINNIKKEAGLIISHFGFGVALIGMIGSTALQVETNAMMKPKESITVGTYTYTFNGLKPTVGKNYVGETAVFSVQKNNEIIATLQPELRLYPVENQTTTEAAIDHKLMEDIYIVLAAPTKTQGQARAVRIYRNPLMFFLWSGLILTAFGGLVAATRVNDTTPRTKMNK